MVLPVSLKLQKRAPLSARLRDGRQTRCFCYVDDTVEALTRLMNSAPAQARFFNVGSTEEISNFTTLAHLVHQGSGFHIFHSLRPYSEAYSPGFEDMARRKPLDCKTGKTASFSAPKSICSAPLNSPRAKIFPRLPRNPGPEKSPREINLVFRPNIRQSMYASFGQNRLAYNLQPFSFTGF